MLKSFRRQLRTSIRKCVKNSCPLVPSCIDLFFFTLLLCSLQSYKNFSCEAQKVGRIISMFMLSFWACGAINIHLLLSRRFPNAILQLTHSRGSIFIYLFQSEIEIDTHSCIFFSLACARFPVIAVDNVVRLLLRLLMLCFFQLLYREIISLSFCLLFCLCV